MNASTRRGSIITVLGALLMAVSPAMAFDLVAPFADPLRTIPERIPSGVTLPGDMAPVACPGNREFTAPLTVGEAVDTALCNNPRIKSAWAAIKVQAGALGEARAAYLPTVSGTVTGMHSSTRYVSSNSTTTTDGFTLYGAVSWRLFDFGARGANRQAACLGQRWPVMMQHCKRPWRM